MHQTLRCLSCEATIRPPNGRVDRVTRCPWCGADPRVKAAAPPEPLPPEETPESGDPDDGPDEPVLIPEETEPYVVSGVSRRDAAPAAPAARRPGGPPPAEDEPKFVDITGPVVATAILFVSFVLAVAGFFVARYLAAPGPG